MDCFDIHPIWLSVGIRTHGAAAAVAVLSQRSPPLIKPHVGRTAVPEETQSKPGIISLDGRVKDQKTDC